MKTDSEIKSIPLDQIVASPHNPRKSFPEEGLAELAESIKRHGLLHPILVTPRGEQRYQIVAGERRWRACQRLGRATIECFVRHLDEKTAISIAVMENIQRSGLNPIEEAAGLQAMIDVGKMTPREVASIIGKGRDYVARMLLLNRLPEAAKEAIRTGRMGRRAGWYIARIPLASLRSLVTSEALSKRLSTAEVGKLVLENYLLDLRKAEFPLHAADLLPEVPSCLNCPSRTGNAKDLYSDISDPMICTDPDCFARKREADWMRRCQRAWAEGNAVVPDSEAVDEFLLGTAQLSEESRYIDLEVKCPWDPSGRRWSALLAEELQCREPHSRLRLFLARSPVGTIHQLLRKEEALSALKRRGYAFARKAHAALTEEDLRKQNERQRAEFIRLSCRSLVSQASQKAALESHVGLDDLFLGCILRLVPRLVVAGVFERQQLKLGTHEETVALVRALEPAKRRALLVDLLFSAELEAERLQNVPDLLRELCSRLAIDIDGVCREVEAVLDQDAQKPPLRRRGRPPKRAAAGLNG
ncbi:Chromosome partitioning protein ParB [Methylacidimicrobium sp. AP8]|uniref:ParB/RepB/Spo0J family partition protein n=1 Tax=Methylacidimicrobium sp. AP8 TaxID=2730359 RepID=UPI0018C0A5BB|nr:ParB/RepB/Spo0J family partition protein [Methylacidimicrobium sp. AP8]CAB4243565.1 Chromosome partitioning protein ParB [Methylacidimicrobium sp. AP8]